MSDCGCERREYMTLREYIEKYPTAYAEAIESMTADQKIKFEARFSDRLLYLPKDETSDIGTVFSITATTTNVTPDADNPTTIKTGENEFWKFEAAPDTETPTVEVTGCDWVQTTTGTLFLFNPYDNVKINVSAAFKTFEVTATGDDCTVSPANKTIRVNDTIPLTVTPSTYYQWNGNATVVNAQWVRDHDDIVISKPTGNVTVHATCDRKVYAFTFMGTNCSIDREPANIPAGATMTFQITPDTGYTLPGGIDVTGCQYTWKQETGQLTIYNATAEVTVIVVAEPMTYTITATVTNGTAAGANVIQTGGTAALTITPNSGYNLPLKITVSGCSYNWNYTTGTIALREPTDNVTVTVVCDTATYTIPAGQYVWKENPSIGTQNIFIQTTFTKNNTAGKLKIFYSINLNPGDKAIRYGTTTASPYNYVYMYNDTDKTWTEDYQQPKFITIEQDITVGLPEYNATIGNGNWQKVEG